MKEHQLLTIGISAGDWRREYYSTFDLKPYGEDFNRMAEYCN